MDAAVKCAETVCRNLDYDDCEIEVNAIARAILADRGRTSGLITQMVQSSADALRLQYGEMTAGEVRTVRAVLTHLAATIRGDT